MCCVLQLTATGNTQVCIIQENVPRALSRMQAQIVALHKLVGCSARSSSCWQRTAGHGAAHEVQASTGIEQREPLNSKTSEYITARISMQTYCSHRGGNVEHLSSDPCLVNVMHHPVRLQRSCSSFSSCTPMPHRRGRRPTLVRQSGLIHRLGPVLQHRSGKRWAERGSNPMSLRGFLEHVLGMTEV